MDPPCPQKSLHLREPSEDPIPLVIERNGGVFDLKNWAYFPLFLSLKKTRRSALRAPFLCVKKAGEERHVGEAPQRRKARLVWRRALGDYVAPQGWLTPVERIFFSPQE